MRWWAAARSGGRFAAILALAGVPRIYGFASAAPKGEYTAPMLERYFDTVGDYRRHLDALTAGGPPNAPLRAAFKGTSLVETDGLEAAEPGARDRVVGLVYQLDVSALQLELGHFAVHMGWLEPERFRALAIEGARRLLTRPLDGEVVDVMCELPKHEQIGGHFDSGDLPEALFRDPEGIRLISCLAPPGDDVSVRIAAALESPDPVLRLWAAHALSRRLPLPGSVLLGVVAHLGDPAPDVTTRLRWILIAQRPLPPEVLRALDARDPALAREARAASRAAR